MWNKVGKEADISEQNPALYQGRDGAIAIFKAEGQYYALDNLCPHRGGPLADGHSDSMSVVCPWHAWKFDLKTGECDGIPGVKQKCYPVKIENGEVWVKT